MTKLKYATYKGLCRGIDEYMYFHTEKRLQNRLNALISMEYRARPLRNFYYFHCLLDSRKIIAESIYKPFKLEFVCPNRFETLEQLNIQLFDALVELSMTTRNTRYEAPVGYRNIILAERTLDHETKRDTATGGSMIVSHHMPSR